MKETQSKRKRRKGLSLLLSIILVFCIFGTIVLTVSRKITREMSEAAIQNLSESLGLIQSTIEAILRSEAEFQTLIAQEIARVEDPEEYIRSYKRNQTMAKLSLILTGRTEGISSTGDPFAEEGLDFSAGGTVEGLAVSQSYVNYMGTWAYTIKCPVERGGQEIGTLYAEYVYDAIDKSLPTGFYGCGKPAVCLKAQGNGTAGCGPSEPGRFLPGERNPEYGNSYGSGGVSGYRPEPSVLS